MNNITHNPEKKQDKLHFNLSLFKNKRDTNPQPVTQTWQQLRERFSKPVIRTDKDGALFSPATFSPAYRRKENVSEISMLVLDIDHHAELETIKKQMAALDAAYIIYSTHSHLRQTDSNPDAEPRFRVCLPLAFAITAKDFPALWRYLKQTTQLPIDESAKDTSRIFYEPAIAAKDAPYIFYVQYGAVLDWKNLPLDIFAKNDDTNTNNKTNGSGQETRNSLEFEFHEDRHLELCRRVEAQAKSTGRAAFEMRCPSHSGKGNTSLFYDPSSGVVACVKKPNPCDYFDVLAAFGLPNGKLPSREYREKAITDALDKFTDEPIPLPEDVSPAPELDENLIPAEWREWLTDISERMQCPLDYPVVAAIVAASALIGNKIRIRPKQHDIWQVTPNLWGAVVGLPSLLKSPAVNEGMFFFREIEKAEREKYEKSLLDAEFDKEFADAKQSELKKQMRGKVADKEKLRTQFQELAVEVPKEKRLSTTDATIEKLGELFNENENGILQIRDELTGWFRGLDRPGREQDRAFYLECWDGAESSTVDRIGRGKIFVKNSTLSILGTIQPAMLLPYLRGSLDGYGDDGLIQRFQMLVYPNKPKTYQFIDRLPKGRDKARNSFKRLYELDPQTIGAKQLADEFGGGYFVQFDDEAQEFFQTWLTELENALRSDTFDTASLEAHVAKYRSLMPSLALIFHLLDCVSNRESNDVSLSNARLAAAWCSYLQNHATRIYQIAVLSEFDIAREILKKIQSKDLQPEFTAREIYGKHWSKLSKPKDVQNGLDILVEYGYLSAVIINEGHRPKTVYLIHGGLQ